MDEHRGIGLREAATVSNVRRWLPRRSMAARWLLGRLVHSQ
ncbi:hypothetical protein BURPS305_2451 [Burkholderia pseudomallei 305]|nr:hypothetical protein BURPS305_2451 [Burkholderia pseudomallei 305]